MDSLANFVAIFLQVYTLCVFVWALMSWLPMASPGLAYNSTVVSIRTFLDSIILPYVRLFRFVQPVQIGGMLLDLSALVAIIVLIIASKYLPGIIAGLG